MKIFSIFFMLYLAIFGCSVFFQSVLGLHELDNLSKLPDILNKGEIEVIKTYLKSLAVGEDVAPVVRGVFHDAVNGQDGCINRDAPGNRGCEGFGIGIMDELDFIYDKRFWDTSISRADFYVLAGIAGIENAVELSNKDCNNDCSLSEGTLCMPMPQLTFKYGRVDCSETGFTDELVPLPGGHFDANLTFGFFADQFGMTVAETVAIMGAHNLGEAKGGSGFIGYWKGKSAIGELEGNRFNTDYYKRLISDHLSFPQELNESPLCSGLDLGPKYQWNLKSIDSSGTSNIHELDEFGFMLNCDMCLLKDIQVEDQAIGLSSCTYETCGDSIGAPYVHLYANNPTAFVYAFESAWEKMTTVGTEGELKEPPCGNAKGGCCDGPVGLVCKENSALCPSKCQKPFC